MSSCPSSALPVRAMTLSMVQASIGSLSMGYHQQESLDLQQLEARAWAAEQSRSWVLAMALASTGEAAGTARVMALGFRRRIEVQAVSAALDARQARSLTGLGSDRLQSAESRAAEAGGRGWARVGLQRWLA